VDYADAGDLVSDVTTNISIGGMFIVTEQELELGNGVDLVVSFPGLVRPIHISGVVRWCQHRTGGLRGVGIEFVDMVPDSQAQLESVLARIEGGDPSLIARPLTVLLVDDNEHVATLIRQGLAVLSKRSQQPLMFMFHTASNGREGLEVAAEVQPDLLIIDLDLPILDGRSLIGALRADGVVTPIIAMSAVGEAGREPALDAGANVYLPKPVRLRELGIAVRSVIDIGD